MKRNPRLIATVLTLSLAPGSDRANVYTQAVVMQARHANLGSSAVTAGASIFDGDRLSTDAKGSLLLRGGGSTIYLSNATQAVLRSVTNGGKDAQAEVGAGTVVFSIQPATPMVISAGGATIHPDTNLPMIGQIAVIDQTSFQISARKGTRRVSYYDDSEIVPEGNSYRVELYRLDDSATATADQGTPRHPKKRKRIALFLIVGGAIAAAAAAGAMAGTAAGSSSGLAKDFESRLIHRAKWQDQ
jgi:hypothetical protein